ncbi:nuclear RNA export factor 2 isoform X2 [Drosophila grimshawi]|uniref:nuclear RNA export factor 2 isoform X2 n=1 Tax=Drosophila grimshawi TaxID=7222 RepID=UPI000C86E907|nr:nuclear RNA export factor 2 isoform X2 [Drosophila grimshawi]
MPASRNLPDRIIQLGDRCKPILVLYQNARKYYKCKSYQNSPGINWLEIRVNHEGVLNFTANPHQLILNAIFDAVEGQQFIPVNYKCGHLVDSFLARSCTPAVDNLFKRGLCIQVSTGAKVYLTVWFNVAEYNSQQILPIVIISQVIDHLLDNLENYQGVQRVLNLSNFGTNPYFSNFVVRLSNLATLQLVCTTIYNNDDRRRSINGFNLANNQISDLGPLKLFGDVDYGLLDLSGNMLHSSKRLCADLARFRAKQINLAQNPLTRLANYPNCLRPLIGNFEIVDGVPFERLGKLYTPLDYEIDTESDGVRVDARCKSNLAQFKDSDDWHAFLIPDPEHEFLKEAFFNFFFISVSPELSEFYPCYYRYIDGEHKFLVRCCYDQIEYLVHSCNLMMEIPQLVADGEEHVLSHSRRIPYYLRMGVCVFRQGQVEPKKCIELAMQKRYSAINRVLNLEQFQKADGLENVIVLLSSPKILQSILRMAARKFLGSCQDLRLGSNGIISLNSLRTLSLLGSLQALDLGYNWIHDLADIDVLREVPLKSLRLHGNPMCRKYPLPSAYIKAVKEICSGLLTLDDVDLSSRSGLAPQKDYLCDTAAYELTGELFLYPFLREFEQLDKRIHLRRFYSDKSIFTLTCSYDITRCARPSNELFKRINKYNYHSRNLLKNSRDTCRINVGAQDIMEVLMQLPVVTHDYVSLQTNVLHYDPNMAVIYVNGVLRDEPELLLAFSRQFVLKVDAVGLGVGKRARRMRIVNESFNIMNPAKKQLRDAFKFQVVAEPTQLQSKEDSSVDGKEHKLHIFKELTGLRPKWCTRVVQEEANWDFKLAIEHFLAMESANELPDDAFL